MGRKNEKCWQSTPTRTALQTPIVFQHPSTLQHAIQLRTPPNTKHQTPFSKSNAALPRGTLLPSSQPPHTRRRPDQDRHTSRKSATFQVPITYSDYSCGIKHRRYACYAIGGKIIFSDLQRRVCHNIAGAHYPTHPTPNPPSFTLAFSTALSPSLCPFSLSLSLFSLFGIILF